jgi:hypothetical protein
VVGPGSEETEESLSSLLTHTTKSNSLSFPEEESTVGLTSFIPLVPTETVADGLTESPLFGSSAEPPECTSDLVTPEAVTTVSTHLTISPGTESLTSKSELTTDTFVFGSGVLPDTVDVSVTVPEDGAEELTSTFLILGVIKLVLKSLTSGSDT